MTRGALVCLFGALVSACAGDVLSAGSNASDAAALPPISSPATRALLSSSIDAFAMDTDSLYFTSEDGFLYRLAKAGDSSPVRLAPATVPPSHYTEGLTSDDSMLYWTAFGDGISTGAVLSVPKTGGTPITLAASQARPTGVAVDATTVYWTNQGPPSPQVVQVGGRATVMSVPKGGGASTVLVSDPAVPDAIALDPTGVIWHEEMAIRRVPKSGGETVTLAQSTIPWASSNLVVSGSTLYWAADQGQWSIQSVGLDGGAVLTLAPAIDDPGGLVALGTSLFWDVAGGAKVGALESEPLGGGDAVVQETSPDVVRGGGVEEARFLLADASAFYWVEYWEAPALTVAIRTRPR